MNAPQYYISCFSSMNCNKYRGNVAPHKDMMLIAVMEEVARRQALKRVLVEKYVPNWTEDESRQLAAETGAEYEAKSADSPFRMAA